MPETRALTAGELGVAAAPRRAVPPGLTLRAKALMAFGAIVLYVLALGTVLTIERVGMFRVVEALERVHQQEEAFGRLRQALGTAILQVNDTYFFAARDADWQELALALEATGAALAGALRHNPVLEPYAARIHASIGPLLAERSRDHLIDVRETLRGLGQHAEALAAAVSGEKSALYESYRIKYDAVTLAGAGFVLLGLVAFGSIVTLFFTRISWDVRTLRARALEIVDGYRGPDLPVTRNDEIGELMQSINQMQSELRNREVRLELSRREHFHQEKMAAIGQLAAGVAHEINNPVAAITGVAEAIAQVRDPKHCVHAGALCRPELILEHARRVAAITRQMADFSAPRSPEPRLIDLNGLVESTCAFVRYDRRYRSVALETDLDRGLPALVAVPDQVTQVLMNLLINAADALEGASGRRPAVQVITRENGEHVVITVRDNGCGMAAETLERAFDDYYTTKPQGRGTGLGLALCRRLVEARGGSVELESSLGEGTIARVRLPIRMPAPQKPDGTTGEGDAVAGNR